MGTLKIMSPTEGDTAVEWAVDNEVETKNAERIFTEIMEKKGMAIFEIKKGEDATDGELVRKFNPNAETLIAVPALQGGC